MKKNQKQFRKPGRFPADVARFFNPQKSGTNSIVDLDGRISSWVHIKLRKQQKEVTS